MTITVYHKGSRIIISRRDDGTYEYHVPGSNIRGAGQRSAGAAQADAERMINEADARIKRTLEWPDSA